MTSVDDGEVTRLETRGIRPLAFLDGHLVYVQADGAVMAVAIDTDRRRATGKVIPVHDPVPVLGSNNGNSGIFIASTGAMVTRRGPGNSQLVWVARDRRERPLTTETRGFFSPVVSPAGDKVAVLVRDGGRDVWIYDVAGGTFSRLTTMGTVTSLEWTSDGSSIVFTATNDELKGGVFRQLATGGSPPERVVQVDELLAGATLSPDGKSLVVQTLHDHTWDLWRVPLDTSRQFRPYLHTAANEGRPRFSPDGRWIAVASNESGPYEVYLRSFPDPIARLQVSVGGGDDPQWSSDGTRVYYLSGTRVVEATLAFSPNPQVVRRNTVATVVPLRGDYQSSYAVSRDGKEFLVIRSDRTDVQLVVAPTWRSELRQRLAASERSDRPR